MALVSCPECQRQVSNMAPACPQCGYPIAGQRTAASVNRHEMHVVKQEHGTFQKEFGTQMGKFAVQAIGWTITLIVCLFLIFLASMK